MVRSRGAASRTMRYDDGLFAILRDALKSALLRMRSQLYFAVRAYVA
jgi:hypothetical protein